MPFFVRPVARATPGRARAPSCDPQIKTHLDFIEATRQGAWFAGCDLRPPRPMSFPLEARGARRPRRDGPKTLAIFPGARPCAPRYTARPSMRLGPFKRRCCADQLAPVISDPCLPSTELLVSSESLRSSSPSRIPL